MVKALSDAYLHAFPAMLAVPHRAVTLNLAVSAYRVCVVFDVEIGETVSRSDEVPWVHVGYYFVEKERDGK
jgi:hypothetical protein